MVYKKATYEEYQKATTFAKFRYKYGVFIQTIAFILLLLLFAYTVGNIEEMKTNPIDYAEEKMGVICMYPITPGVYGPMQLDIEMIQNGS